MLALGNAKYPLSPSFMCFSSFKWNSVIDTFIFYFWLCWVFVAVLRLSLVVVSGGYSSWGRGLLIAEHGTQ